MTDATATLLFEQYDAAGDIRVWQQQNQRWLEFNDGLIQSKILIDVPEVLPLVLNRAMLAGILFTGIPKRVLLAGVGGGAMARYFAKRFPDIHGEGIEISETVIAIAKDFFDFPRTKNWQLISDDIVYYIDYCQQRYDLIIIDIAQQQKTPQWIINKSFLQHCRDRLTEQGHIALNLLVDDAAMFLEYLAAIRSVFNGNTACLSLTEHRNIVILAFNNRSALLPKQSALDLAKLAALLGIELSGFYQQMLQDNPENSGIF